MKDLIQGKLKQFSHLILFKTEKGIKTYADFNQDIVNQEKRTKLNHDNKQVVKNADPYEFLIEIFTLWLQNKVPILISSKENLNREILLLNQISKEIITDEALILFTSGSTGIPKGISITFSNLIFQAESFIHFFKSNPSEVYFLNLPLHHIGGFMLFFRAFMNGGVISTRENEKFSYISLVPHQLPKWITKLTGAKAILIGGAYFPKALKEKTAAFKLPIFETYGMTETTSFITLNGKQLPGIEMRIDATGTVAIKGPMLAAGFYQNQKFTAFSDWYQTHDLGNLDADNLFHFHGRKKNLLISGGENINPLEIEQAALEIEGITMAYAVGIPDEKWGDLITLLYQGENPQLANELKKCLHPYHVPKLLLQTIFQKGNDLKMSFETINNLAYELFLKNIFSHSYSFISDEKPTLVILHGFMESKEDWNFLNDHLSSTHNILTIDLPGHGSTSLKYFSSLHEILTRLRDFIFLYSKKPILLVYSMGGRIALRLAQEYFLPEMLILISASLGLNTEEEKINRLNSDAKLFDKINDTYSLKDFFYDWYQMPMFRPYFDSPFFQEDIEKKVLFNYQSWASSLQYFSPGVFPLKTEYNLPVPMVYFAGSMDVKYITDNAILISGAGHNPHKTHPDLLAFKIKECLIAYKYN